MRAWHRRCFIPLTLAGGMLLVGWWWVSSTPLAKLRASGAPTTFEELLPEPIPDGQNVAAGLRDLMPILDAGVNQVVALRDELESIGFEGPLLEKAKRWRSEATPTLDALKRTVERPAYASLLQADEITHDRLLDEMQAHRNAIRSVSLACRVALAEGNPTEAAEAAIAGLRFGKWIEHEPSLAYRLVACAIQETALNDVSAVSAGSGLSQEMINRLDKAIATIEDRSSLRWALESERAFAIENFSEVPAYVRVFEQPAVLRLLKAAIGAVDGPVDELADRGDAICAEVGMFGTSMAIVIPLLFEAEARVGLQARRLRESLKDR